MTEAMHGGLLFKKSVDRIADGGRVILIDAMGREVVHKLHADLVASFDGGLDVARGLLCWGVFGGIACRDPLKEAVVDDTELAKVADGVVFNACSG